MDLEEAIEKVYEAHRVKSVNLPTAVVFERNNMLRDTIVDNLTKLHEKMPDDSFEELVEKAEENLSPGLLRYVVKFDTKDPHRILQVVDIMKNEGSVVAITELLDHKFEFSQFKILDVVEYFSKFHVGNLCASYFGKCFEEGHPEQAVEEMYWTLSDEEVKKTTEMYYRKKGFNSIIARIFHEAHAFSDAGIVSDIAKKLSSDDFREFVELDHKNDDYIKALASVIPTNRPELIQKTKEFLTKCLHKDCKYVDEAINGCYVKDNKYKSLVIDILDKYFDSELEAVALRINVGKLSHNDLYELLSDRAYNTICNSKDPYRACDRIIGNNYSDLRPMIDTDVLENVSYGDLDIVMRSYKIVMHIHNKRLQNNKIKICTEYFKEMNRAMKQVDDMKDKIKIMKQYSLEVESKIKNIAEELMFRA